MSLNRHTSHMVARFTVLALAFTSCLASAQSRIENVIYMKSQGAAFTMDVVKPAHPNKAAVVFMVSGGWYSDHAMLKTLASRVEDAFAEEGFTVFSVVHGAQPRFQVGEIVGQVRTAVKFIDEHLADYGIEPHRVGVTGISSGGHLSLMIGGSADSPVDAVVAIAPPTDFLNWGKDDMLMTDIPELSQFAPALGFDLKAPKSETADRAKAISPIQLVSDKFPPCLIVHGDKDLLVPLQQAEVMDRALAKAGVDHKLSVIAGGAHDEKTFVPGVVQAIEWFKKKLLKS